MVGVFADDLAQFVAVAVFLALFVEEDRHRDAARGALCGLNFEAGFAVAGPLPGSVFGGLPRDHFDLVRHHESAVEAHAKLADEIGVPLGVAAKGGEKVLRAGTGDGAQMANKVVAIHADSVVADCQGAGFFVQIHLDTRLERQRLVRFLCQVQVLQLVQRIGGV